MQFQSVQSDVGIWEEQLGVVHRRKGAVNAVVSDRSRERGCGGCTKSGNIRVALREIGTDPGDGGPGVDQGAG